MPDAAGHAARRRDVMLARTRRVSLGIAASAAVASIGLGAVLAREIPGHHALAASVRPGPAQQQPAQQGSARAGVPGTPAPAGGTPAQQPSAAPQPAQRLSQPPQAPAPAQTAPPHATSGGS
jgi:hypothetical protein